MVVRKDIVLRALLKRNYFPSQKKRKEEMPPIFNTSSITEDIAKEINNVTLSPDRKILGFDLIQFNATRYNNIPRLLTIPHPKPYIDLCLELYKNWRHIRYICLNTNSLILPRKHSDGRVIIMDYDTSLEKRNRHYKSAFGKKFLVHTDIANCYPSIYSHVIPWALVGIPEAKRNQKDRSLWFNRIDKTFRFCCRNETMGVPIGPATSNIACEIILERIDEKLRANYDYVRFIDDYTAYCKTHVEAEEFIRDLSIELLKYKFNLNIRKTEIQSLPQAINSNWVSRVKEVIPSEGVINSSQVSDIMDAAVRLHKENPDGSVLKYAVNSIVNRVDDRSSLELIKYVIKLCYHYPILIPTLYQPLKTVYRNSSADFKDQFLFLLHDSIIYRRSDAVSWLLFYLKKFHNDIPADISEEIISNGDCIALTILADFTAHEGKVVNFANQLDKNDLLELDNYWLLLYQLYLKRKIRNPYTNDNTFKVLSNHMVSFIKY